jgi:hypothetical protein
VEVGNAKSAFDCLRYGKPQERVVPALRASGDFSTLDTQPLDLSTLELSTLELSNSRTLDLSTLIKNIKFYILRTKVIYIISYLILIIIRVIRLSFKLSVEL